MEQIIKTLQEIQIEAIRKGVAAFHLDAVRHESGEYVILVAVTLRNDDTDGDYLGEVFHTSTENPELLFERIRTFINTL